MTTSDGWYDHAYRDGHEPIVRSRPTSSNGPGMCGTGTRSPRRRRQAGQRPLRPRHAHPVPGDLAVGQGRTTSATTRISQASVVRFIEDNWLHGQRLGGGSFDATAGSIMDMFDFASQGDRDAALSSIRRRATGGRARPGVALNRDHAALLAGRYDRPAVAVCCGAGRSAAAHAVPLAPGCTTRASSVRRGENPHPVQSRPSARSRRSRPWRNWAGSVLRPEPVVVGKAVLRLVPQPGPCLRPARRRPVDVRRPDADGQGVRAVPSLMYLERQPNFSIGPDDDENETVSWRSWPRRARPRPACRRPPAHTAQRAANLVPQGGLFWDGRADTLQDQAIGPLLIPLEMDGGSVEAVAAKLRHAPYADRFSTCSAPTIFENPQLAGRRGDVRRRALPDRGAELSSLHQQIRCLARRQGAVQRQPNCAAICSSTIRQSQLRRLPSRPADAGRSAAALHRSPVRSARRAAQHSARGQPRSATISISASADRIAPT